MLRYLVLLYAIGVTCATVLPQLSAGRNDLAEPLVIEGRIVGGENADIRDYPHQISMRYRGRHRCGGSIYSPNIIVSAAHCVVNVNATDLTIAAGSTLLSVQAQELPVHRIIVHENYSGGTNDYDITILVLKGQFQFNEFVQPIKMASSRPAGGSEVTVTGWGTLVSGGDIPDKLQQVNLYIKSQSDCRRSYLLLLSNRMICAAVDGGGKDSCQGDSGGPLIYGKEQVGIVSWGFGCGMRTFPGVYASVADLHEWIVATVKANESYVDFL